VLAIDSETRITIAQDVTSADRGFAFELTDLPPNSYKIYAGTDRDGDDQICDLGELCGGFPSAIAANEVTVEASVIMTGIDFAVGDIIFEPQSAQRVTTRPIRLLD
jgi:serine protease